MVPRMRALPKLVGFSGVAGAGKDESAKGLAVRFGFQRVALADPLKQKAQAEHGWDGNKDEPGRHLLQALGVQYREQDPDYWVRLTETRIDLLDTDVCVTDVRFPNEADMILRRGGILVRVDRPGAGLTGPAGDHPSENAWRDLPFDYTILNDGTIEDLHHKARAVVLDEWPELCWEGAGYDDDDDLWLGDHRYSPDRDLSFW